MKNLLKSILAVTAAAMAFVGCEKEQSLASQNNEETKTLKLVVDNQPMNQTKTQMNQAGTDVIWSNQEKVNFYADSKYLHSSDVTASVVNDKLEAKLTVPTAIKEIDGFFGASYNRNTEVKDKNTDFVSAFGISLPEMQSITVNTFDPLADALVMETKDVSGSDLTQPVTGIVYHRLHAITKLSFKGLENYVTDQVVSVEFSTQNADLAGNFTYDFKTRKFVDNTTGAEKAGSIFTESPSKSVVMTLPENTLLDANFAAWMVSAAQTLKAGEVVTVTINTDKHRITGSFKLPADKTFVNTQLNALTLNMSKATVTPVKTVKLEPGDYVIAVKEGASYYAMNTGANGGRRSFEEITYVSGTYEAANANVVWTFAEMGVNSFSIKNGTDYLHPTKNGASLGTTAQGITVENGTAEGTYKLSYDLGNKDGVRYLKKNAGYGFGFYADDNDIYLIPAVVSTKPQLEAPVVDVLGEAQTITVSWTDVPNATSYVVNCGELPSQTIAAGVEITEFTNVPYGKYVVTVTAIADNYLSAESLPHEVTLVNPNASSIVLTFPAETQKPVNSYAETWQATMGGHTWSIANFNNFSNGWNHIRAGSKKGASNASITSDKIADPVSSVVVTVDAATADVTESKLEIASDPSFSTILSTVPVACQESGAVTYNVPTPTAKCFYRLSYTIDKPSGNGPLRISKIEYVIAK